ncbi:MAG: hypothetical protein CMB10_04025, partial [Euryarchaeota archaeon]|nr:hypothetical protein [Euryarchaeota archaeon]
MRKSIVYTLIACLLVSSIPFSVTADATDDIPTNAASTGIHDSLVAALTQADLVTTLQGDGPFTVFAPTDQAFIDAGIDLTTFDTDEENATLVDILTYHVVSGKVMSSDLTDGMEASALNQDTLTFSVSATEVKVNDAVVTAADVESSNGVIHVIDKVLMPPADLVDIPATAQSTGVHTALVAALSQANLVATLQGTGPFTVFAPTDQAFTDAGIDLTTFDTDEENATLVDILTYHVVSGTVVSSDLSDGMEAAALNQDTLTFSVSAAEVKVNDAVVTTADVATSNGVIHVIDKVLMPPADLVDIPATAQTTGVHTALVAALAQANLVATLQGTGPFTVFAPTDQAFADAGIDLTTFDTDEENATLVDILTYHVVSGTVLSSDLTDGMEAAALNQDTLTFSVSATEVKVNDAVVTTADVATSNGVIHVIDKVLMPPADVAPDPFEGIDCAVTIGLTADGYGFNPSITSINVGQTVCWSWTDAVMGHNVKQVDGALSSTFVANGVTSGAAATTVAFHHTFTENQTFYYACEPHISMNMFGEIVVGDGGVEPTSDADDDENTPG